MDINHAISKTLVYSDIFDYPLTKAELWRYLITSNKVSKSEFEQNLKKHPQVEYYKGYFILKGKKTLIRKREEKIKTNQIKKTIALRAAKILSLVPGVVFVGISGSVSMQNADDNDDIDLIILTKKDVIFITRLFCALILNYKKMLRRRNSLSLKNKICLNLFIDKDYIFEISKQNLYTAHELAQVVPLFERKNSFESFLQRNNWVKKYLINSTVKSKVLLSKYNLVSQIFYPLLILINFPAKYLQLFLMRKVKTREILTDKILAFHPNDYQADILASYQKKLELLNL